MHAVALANWLLPCRRLIRLWRSDVHSFQGLSHTPRFKMCFPSQKVPTSRQVQLLLCFNVLTFPTRVLPHVWGALFSPGHSVDSRSICDVLLGAYEEAGSRSEQLDQ